MADPEALLTQPTPKLQLRRLSSALRMVDMLQPSNMSRHLVDGPSFNAYMACTGMFIDEEPMPAVRTKRDNLCLQAAGMVVATYWMDVYPSRGVPHRDSVELFFQAAHYPESPVVGPLTTACAGDEQNTLSNRQRSWMRGIVTFEELEYAIALLDESPRPDDGYVHSRTVPISHENVVSAVQPVAAELTETLINEGHRPFDAVYAREVHDRFKALPW